jgi:Fe-S-cluster containining protein
MLALEQVSASLDKQSAQMLGAARADGRPENRPACGRGCAACCHQLVPVSTIEAQRIAEHLRRLPRSERRDLAKAVDRQAERFAAWVATRPPGDVSDRVVNANYLRQRIPCPFLGKEKECRIYPVRPLICRGHHALGTNANCQDGDKDIRSIPALFHATEEAMLRARRITAELGVATQGGLMSTFASLFRAALTGGVGSERNH